MFRRQGKAVSLRSCRTASIRAVIALRQRRGVSLMPMSVDEIQAAVIRLSSDELERFSRWLDEYRADLWDQRIEADILAGRLETAGRRADEDFEAGRCTPPP
jgi:hypothetical protein